MAEYVRVLFCLVGISATFAIPYQIKGGQNATFGQYPSMVSLQKEGCDTLSSSSYLHFCSGLIISPTHILTAAHCVNKQDTRFEILKIVAGLTDVTGGDETYRQDVDIETITVHPGYTTEYEQFWIMTANDIAVVKLSTALNYNDFVQPITLPEEDTDLDDNTEMEFSGWGNQVCFEESNPRLKTINFTTLNFQTCYDALMDFFYDKENLVTIKKKLSICTGPLTNGTNISLWGDSGGPLIKDGIVYGLHSWSVDYGASWIPDEFLGPTGIYVKLSSYISWIKENVDDL